MATSTGWRMAGMEVPLLNTDSIDWRQLSVPSSSSTSTADTLEHQLAKDFASCCAIGDSPTYVIWKTSRSQSNLLEIILLPSQKETSWNGLRLIFRDALYPFAFVYKDESKNVSGNYLVLYALTISGIAYRIVLKSNFDYGTSSRVPTNDILEHNTQVQGTVTAVAAAAGFLLIGRSDGSIGVLQLGVIDPSESGFVYELRDDAGFGRLWGILSRSPTLAAVQDLVVSDVMQRKLLFVLHSDGSFRVWDLLSRSKIFSHAMTVQTLTGAFVKLWVGETSDETGMIPLALLHKQNLEVSTATLLLCGLHCNVGERAPLSLEPSSRKVSLGEGEPIDVIVTSDKVWILKEEGLVMQDFFCNDVTVGSAHYYGLQEAFIADLLFQSSEHASDDLLWLAYSTFSSSKEEIIPFVSSVFLHALLFPGVYSGTVLRRTLGDYNKHYTDSEFGSFAAGGLKAEILSIIEHQNGIEGPVAILQCWKNLCSRYINNWCKYNASCGLLMDPLTGAIGLVRKNTISLFRGLEDAEHIIYGSFEEGNNYTNHGNLDQKILFELLQCVRHINQQLGKASSAIFYELLLRSPHTSLEDVVVRILKILETGYSSSIAAVQISELGADTAWEKELSNHKNLRKFSTNMLLSLHSLHQKANSWGNVLDVVLSYLKFLVPQKVVLNVDGEASLHVNYTAIVHSVSQIAKVMFESILDVLVLLGYMTSIGGQINMSQDDVLRIKSELIPMIQEIITEWHIIHFFGTTPSEPLAVEDFSYQLSSLQIDSNVDKKLWNGKLGKCEFPLAYVLLLSMQSSCAQSGNLPVGRFGNPSTIFSLSREFTSWIIWGRSRDESSVFFSNSVDLALVLLRHGQYNAAEYLLALVDAYSRKEKILESLQAVNGKLSVLVHLLGGCFVAQTQHGLHGPVKDQKVGEAICCFFRAASMEESSEALRSLPHEAGRLRIDFSTSASVAEWKLQYYQWVMQLFEQYNLSEAACRFALAALEQVDEALNTMNGSSSENFMESVTTIKGRLWANVFKFTLDLDNYHDAYCAIISNPDEESKNICLRRFIIVLYERGAIKILCDGQLPFIGLADRVERELAWKAERSDISIKPNPFKLLYTFEMRRHNWRKAASYIYLYSLRLKVEAAMKDHKLRSLTLQERLNGLAASINALQLVYPAYAWIDSPADKISLGTEEYPNKKARITEQGQSNDALPQKVVSYLDVDKLEKEFTLTSAEHVLSLVGVKWTSSGNEKPSDDLIDLLVEASAYDMAFAVILKFWKGSGLNRELERVFIAMALKCRPNRLTSSIYGKDHKVHGLLLTSYQNDVDQYSMDAVTMTQQFEGGGHWETLELYLDKYRAFHPRLPLIVAGTLLSADSQIELPLWLIRHFKGGRNEISFGMSGGESNPASLFRLYVNYGRYVEAINLLVEYMETLRTVRPADVIRRKKPFAVWFPYTSIERLWCLLEESIKLGHRIDQCEKLKKLLHGVLMNHLNLMKVDSEDVQSSAG